MAAPKSKRMSPKEREAAWSDSVKTVIRSETAGMDPDMARTYGEQRMRQATIERATKPAVKAATRATNWWEKLFGKVK